jgi:hypothetical protein
MPEVNYIAVVGAAISAFVLGGLWYSPLLFAKRWMAYTGNECAEGERPKGNMAVIFGGSFVLNLVAAFVLAMFLGPMPLKFAALAGLSVGLCWVATSFGVNDLFERRPFGLWLINAGYAVLQYTIMGAIIGAFNSAA